MQYCYNSPWCETDQVCRCEKWAEEEKKEAKPKFVENKPNAKRLLAALRQGK